MLTQLKTVLSFKYNTYENSFGQTSSNIRRLLRDLIWDKMEDVGTGADRLQLKDDIKWNIILEIYQSLDLLDLDH